MAPGFTCHLGLLATWVWLGFDELYLDLYIYVSLEFLLLALNKFTIQYTISSAYVCAHKSVIVCVRRSNVYPVTVYCTSLTIGNVLTIRNLKYENLKNFFTSKTVCQLLVFNSYVKITSSLK